MKGRGWKPSVALKHATWWRLVQYALQAADLNNTSVPSAVYPFIYSYILHSPYTILSRVRCSLLSSFFFLSYSIFIVCNCYTRVYAHLRLALSISKPVLSAHAHSRRCTAISLYLPSIFAMKWNALSFPRLPITSRCKNETTGRWTPLWNRKPSLVLPTHHLHIFKEERTKICLQLLFAKEDS